MNLHIDILKIFKENNIEESEKYLKNFIVDCYKKIRKDSNMVDSVYEECQYMLYNLFPIMEHLNPYIRYRLISLISLKNNITIQKEITKEKLDIFYNELMFFASDDNLINKESTIYKVITTLAQIQYGYNIIKCKISLKNDYERFVQLLENNIDIIYSYYMNKKNIDLESYELSVVYLYSSLFEQHIDNSTLEKIIFCWKIPKLRDKTSTYNAEFLDLNKYDFIY